MKLEKLTGLITPIYVAVILCSLSVSSVVQAQFLDNITIGNPKALALGHAVTADPPGIDSIHFNPAGLANIQGRQYQIKLLAAHFEFQETIGDRHLEYAAPGIEEAYESIAGKPYPNDPAENTTAATSTPALFLPGAGLTELPFLAFPLAGIAVEDPNTNMVMATAVYSPQAFGYKREDDGYASWQGQSLAITRITYLSPSIAFKFSPSLSLGASINFSWQGLGIRTKIRAPETTLAFLNDLGNDLDDIGLSYLQTISPYDTIGRLEVEAEDELSLGFNLGWLWQPMPWFSLGMVYRSESKSDLKGSYKMSYTDEWLAMTQSAILRGLSPALAFMNGGFPLNSERDESGSLTTELIQPQHIALGMSVMVLPDFKVNLDVKWADYGTWDSIDLELSDSIDFLTISDLVYSLPASQSDGDNADPNILRLKRNYESVLTWAIGFEYSYSDALVLRWGYEPRKSVVPDDRVDFLSPLAAADLYTVGFGYQIDGYTSIEMAFGYLKSQFAAEAGESKNSNSVNPGNVVYNPYAYLDIAQDIDAYLFALSWDSKF